MKFYDFYFYDLKLKKSETLEICTWFKISYNLILAYLSWMPL